MQPVLFTSVRKLINIFIVVALATVAVGSYLAGRVTAPMPAKAAHINEPIHPITSFELIVEDYANNVHVQEGDTVTFRKFRIEPIAESAPALAAQAPSEHFGTGYSIDRKVFNPNKPNTFTWMNEDRVVWDHQNMPAWHTGDSTKFNTCYATITPGQPNGGCSHNLVPGVYRITAELLGHESEKHFIKVLNFTVAG